MCICVSCIHAFSAVCAGSETPEESTGGQLWRLPGTLRRSHRPRSSGQGRTSCPQGRFTIRTNFYMAVSAFSVNRLNMMLLFLFSGAQSVIWRDHRTSSSCGGPCHHGETTDGESRFEWYVHRVMWGHS